jgi:aspartyl-tRNA(Asn)/glutamyl-tRNA(Gln) amidotransferase subunit B
LSGFFDRTLGFYSGDAQAVANWLGGDVTGYLNANNLTLESSQLTPENLAQLVSLVEGGVISGKIAKDLLPETVAGSSPEALVRERGLEQLTDASAVERVIEQVIAENATLVEQAKTNPKAINALLGRVMKATGGKAKPELVRELLTQKLGW